MNAANPIRARFRNQPLFSSIPGSFPWILLPMLAAAIALPFSRIPSAAGPEPLPQVETQIETRITAVGEDQHHRRLSFTVFVLAEHLSWKLESSGDLEGGQTIISPDLIAAINQACDVFCVGTASVEGERQAEEARAAQRAFKLAQWVGEVMGNSSHARLFALNAGQYRGPKELLSSQQRRAIILATLPHDDVDLGEGLRSGLQQIQQSSPFVFSLLRDYSRSNEWLRISPDAALTDGSKQTGTAIPRSPQALANRR